MRVVRAVKGSLAGEVVVSQQGGLDEHGDPVEVDGDRPLEVGQTYLFASLTNEKAGWHTLIPHFGIRSARSSDAKTTLVDRFETAERTQVPYSPKG